MTCQGGMCRGTSEGGFCITDAECGEGLTCQTFQCQPDTTTMCTEPNQACSGSGSCCDGTTCAPHYDMDNIMIPPEDRWHLVNYILSLGYAVWSMDGKYEARSWAEVEPCWPWHSSFDVMLLPK